MWPLFWIQQFKTISSIKLNQFSKFILDLKEASTHNFPDESDEPIIYLLYRPGSSLMSQRNEIIVNPLLHDFQVTMI